MADSDLPTYRKAVYIVFDFAALGCILEGVPRIIKGEEVLGWLLIASGIVLIVIGIFIARRVDNLYNTIRDALDKEELLSENSELKARLKALNSGDPGPDCSSIKKSGT